MTSETTHRNLPESCENIRKARSIYETRRLSSNYCQPIKSELSTKRSGNNRGRCELFRSVRKIEYKSEKSTETASSSLAIRTDTVRCEKLSQTLPKLLCIPLLLPRQTTPARLSPEFFLSGANRPRKVITGIISFRDKLLFRLSPAFFLSGANRPRQVITGILSFWGNSPLLGFHRHPFLLISSLYNHQQ